MYHIPKDERSLKSAEKIYQSLRHLLFNKKLEEISICDIQKECGVSRSTFYRLFDNTFDVLSMKLHFFMDEYFNTTSSDDKLLNFFLYWDRHSELIYLLSKQAEVILKEELKSRSNRQNVNNIYYVEVQASIISALLCKWVERKKKETPEEMCKIAREILKNSNQMLTII